MARAGAGRFTAGGAIFDAAGGIGVVTASGFILLHAALMILAGVRFRQAVAAA